MRLHYTGTLADGTAFDSSAGRDPLEVTLGSGQIIPGLEQAIPGMVVGDRKVVEVPADEAYGQAHENARQDIPRSQIPDSIPLEVGIQLEMQAPDGQAIAVRVVALTDETVILDANHPLAGKDLTFAIELISIG